MNHTALQQIGLTFGGVAFATAILNGGALKAQDCHDPVCAPTPPAQDCTVTVVDELAPPVCAPTPPAQDCPDAVCPPTQQQGHSETTEIDVDAGAAAGAEASTDQGQQQTQVFAPTNVAGGNTTDTMNVLPPNTPPASIGPGGMVDYTLTCGTGQEKITVQAAVVSDTPVAVSFGIPGAVGFSVATQRSSVVGGDRAEAALVDAMEGAASMLQARAQQTPAQRFQDVAALCNGQPPQQPYTPTQPNVPVPNPVHPQQSVVPVVPNTPPPLKRGSTDTLPPTAYMFFTDANSNG